MIFIDLQVDKIAKVNSDFAPPIRGVNKWGH